jgi:hypothetical protein
MTNFDALFKVGISGIDTDLKKRIFLGTTNNFDIGYKNAIGVGFGIKTIYFENHCFKLQVWDFSSRDYFNYIRPLYLKGAYGIIIVIDQFNISNLSKYFDEILLNCGQIPIILVVECDSHFKRTFERRLEQIDRSNLNFFIKNIEDPLNIFTDLTEKLIARFHDENSQNQIDFFINDNLSGIFSDEEIYKSTNLLLNIIQNQEDRIGIHYNRGREELSNLANQNSRGIYELRHSPIKDKNFEHFIKIIKSLEIEIDKQNRYAIIKKYYGVFKIDILNNLVKFTPRECENCKNKCYLLNRSLCIEKRTIGWSNVNLNTTQMFMLSILYAIKSNNLPDSVLDQIKRMISSTWRYNQASNIINGLFIIIKNVKNKFKAEGWKYFFQLLKNIFYHGLNLFTFSILHKTFEKTLKHLINIVNQKVCELKQKRMSSISTLRDEMLRELNRLRELMME